MSNREMASNFSIMFRLTRFSLYVYWSKTRPEDPIKNLEHDEVNTWFRFFAQGSRLQYYTSSFFLELFSSSTNCIGLGVAMKLTQV